MTKKMWLMTALFAAGTAVCFAQGKTALSDLTNGVRAVPAAPKAAAAPAVKPLSGPAAEAASLIKELLVQEGRPYGTNDDYNQAGVEITCEWMPNKQNKVLDFVASREKSFWKKQLIWTSKSEAGLLRNVILDPAQIYRKETGKRAVAALMEYMSKDPVKSKRLENLLSEYGAYHVGFSDEESEIVGADLFIFHFGYDNDAEHLMMAVVIDYQHA